MKTPFDNYHVYPVHDLKEHDTESLDCWCDPRIENDLPHYVVVHNSADKRELTEENMEDVIKKAKLKAQTMKPDNSAPLMTHDIEKDGCNGLDDCPVCP